MTDIRINKKSQLQALDIADINGLQTALNARELSANKTNDVTTDTGSTDKYPTVKAVETYVSTIAANLDGDLQDHITDYDNPHKVTKAQVGLENVDNTSDADKPVSTAQATAIQDAIDAEVTARNAAITTATLGLATSATVTSLTNKVTAIEGKIPEAASTENKLADKAFVNSSINNMASFYITYDAAGAAFPTRADLINATAYYNQGKERTPTRNDYAIVTADETKNNATTRYMFDGTQWAFQWVINNAPFTQGQVDAINSGITASAVTEFSDHVDDENNPHNVTKAQVGLENVDNTADLDKPISTATQTALNAKADKATTYTKTDVDGLLDDKQDIITVEGPLALDATNKLTIAAYTGATATTAGVKGIVPASTAGSLTRFLNVDGTWKEVAQPVRYEMDLSDQLDGTALTFTLTENVGTDFDVYYNGMRLKNNKNYTITGTTLTLTLSVAPEAGEDLDIIYRK